jgi:3-octaprenyl-4-hydroxybenzoate carboxy-lyase C-terminal domain
VPAIRATLPPTSLHPTRESPTPDAAGTTDLAEPRDRKTYARDVRAESAGLPTASAWGIVASAFHWLIVAVRPDWPESFGGHSGELARRIGQVTFAGKAGFGVPKIVVVEDDIDITSVNEVVWAFATRAHPEHGEVRFPAEPTQVAGEVYLDAYREQWAPTYAALGRWDHNAETAVPGADRN